MGFLLRDVGKFFVGAVTSMVCLVMVLVLQVIGLMRVALESMVPALRWPASDTRSRTPDSRFANLPGYAFEPHYLTTDSGLRIHYVDEGPRNAVETIVCLHGEPTWSYLYRKMIPGLVRDGYRVVAFDFIGFGKSDKLESIDDYRHSLHSSTLVTVMTSLDLRNVTLVVQDWGGLVGLSTLYSIRGRVARLVIMNTGVPPHPLRLRGIPNVAAFMVWRSFAYAAGRLLPVGRVLGLSTRTRLSAREIAAYDAPFSTWNQKAGAVMWPAMVPLTPWWPFNRSITPYAQMAAGRAVLADWTKPALVMFSDCPVTGALKDWFAATIPSVRGKPEFQVHIDGAGHFLQEDQPLELVKQISAFIGRTPRAEGTSS